jgi:prepilin-type N-terminal cleavage/methylation domain-containing protein
MFPVTAQPGRENGFTLIEMMIALLILGVALAALAPAFYGTFRAASTTNYRSIANGIALQATEQMRSLPYYEVGFHATPTGCPTTTAVILDGSVSAPLETVVPQQPPIPQPPLQQQVGYVNYNILRCVNWTDSSIASDTLAYKQSVVTVSWTINRVSGSLTQTSALYPGGEGTYPPGGKANYDPGSTPSTTLPNQIPDPPTNVTAKKDSTNPIGIIDVSWTAPSSSPTPNTYDLWYTSQGDPGTSAITAANGGQEVTGLTGTSTTLTVGADTTYWIQVVSVYGSNLSTKTSNTASAKTDPAPPPCIVTGIAITPAGTPSSPEVLNHNGTPFSGPSVFTVSVNTSGSCSGVQVGYNPSACTLATSPTGTGCSPSAYLTPTPGVGGLGTLSATTPSGQKWQPGTQGFLVYVNTNIYSPATEAQSYMCVEKKNTGKC